MKNNFTSWSKLSRNVATYLLGKETILHTDHHPLIFINSQSKIQEKRHIKWASYIQQFHLVI
jgi:hypothetical protein